eukprot:2860977-Rhodomonas_salina.1
MMFVRRECGYCQVCWSNARCWLILCDEGARVLAGVLGERHLDLRINCIGDEGVGILAGVLGKCTALAHLDLSGNRFGAEGAGVLASVLGECKEMEILTWERTRLVQRGWGGWRGCSGWVSARRWLILT